MSSEPSIAARHALAILEASMHAGVPRDALLRAARIDGTSLIGADARIALTAHGRLWAEAVRMTGDEALAVRIGSALSPGRHGVLEPIIFSSATVGDALERYMRLERLAVDGAVTTLRLHGDDAIVSHGPRSAGDECSPFGVEVTFAAFLAIARSATTAAFVPRALTLRRTAPADVSAFEQLLRIHPSFGAADDALVIDRALLRTPMRSSNPALAAVVEKFAEHQLARLPAISDATLAPRVVAWLAPEITNGTPGMRAAAAALSVSVRTLQRKLQAEGTSFAELVDQSRRQVALEHARDEQAPLDVVALLAGFSEKRAFYRAFRRWTGMTPAVYRASAIRQNV